MKATVLEPRPARERLALVAMVVASIVAHGVAAALASAVPHTPPPPPPEVWSEVVLVEPPPPPEPEPEPEPVPEPEPEPLPEPEVEPEVVEFEDTTPTPVEQAPPPTKKRRPVRRMVQGLSNKSFAEGSGTNLTVRAGTTTSAKAGSTVMDVEDATEFATLPFQSVSAPPRLKVRPMISVPETLRAAEVSGVVQVELTISAQGRVSKVELVGKLHPDADKGCMRDVRASRWHPGTKDGAPVTVTGVPFTCRYEVLN